MFIVDNNALSDSYCGYMTLEYANVNEILTNFMIRQPNPKNVDKIFARVFKNISLLRLFFFLFSEF